MPRLSQYVRQNCQDMQNAEEEEEEEAHGAQPRDQESVSADDEREKLPKEEVKEDEKHEDDQSKASDEDR